MGEVDPTVWDRFDSVWVQDYTGYSRDRTPILRRELDRVGLLGKARWRWNFPTPFTKAFARTVRIPWDCNGDGTFDCTHGHYSIVKAAYDLGSENLLVMEDDARFLLDPALLSEIVSLVPDDYDFAKFEWFTKGTDPAAITAPSNMKNSRWACSRWFGMFGCGLYALSRRGMKWKIDAMEKAAERVPGASYEMNAYRSIDRYDGPSYYPDWLNVYAAVPVAVVQSSGFRAMHARNKGYGTFLSGGTRDNYGRD